MRKKIHNLPKRISLIIIGVVMTASICSGCFIPKNFNADYYWGSHKYSSSAFLINSKQAFDDLISDAELYKFDGFNAYDDGFFDRSSLIAVFLPSGSGSVKYVVKNLEAGPNSVVVQFDRFSPQMQTCDMSYWLVLIDSHQKLPSNINLGFSFNDVSQRLPDLRTR